MTKKSASRLARDAAEKELQNTSVWDDVSNICRSCYGLLRSHLELQKVIENVNIRSAIKDTSLFEKNIRVLTKDLISLNQELLALNELHKDKKGKATNPDDHLLGISIYEKYHMFMERHQNVVMPTVAHLIDQLGEAEKILADAKQKADITDPSVISDAVIVTDDVKPDSPTN